MYLVKTPLFVQSLFKRVVWKLMDSKKIYLTFDDGPIPEATPWVLDLLKTKGVKATFFCVGANVHKHPDIYQRILDEGHAVGNHTYNHLNAWKVSHKQYLKNTEKADNLINSKLFRPPYGKITPRLVKKLSEKYHVVMWDVLSGDFDSSLSAEKCLTNVTSKTESGSIIVFHDSIKSIDKLRIVLPQVIDIFLDQGYFLDKIEKTPPLN